MEHFIYDGQLELSNRQELAYSEEGSVIYQVDDGTRYYYQPGPPTRLNVKWQLELATSSEFHDVAPAQANACLACLPEGIIGSVSPHGNAIYIEYGGKISKADFTLADGIIVSPVRDLLRNESVQSAGLCSRVLSGKKYVYRICDDPGSDGILLDVPEERMQGLKLWCIHKGKAYFVLENHAVTRPSVQKLSENAVLLEMPGPFPMVSYASDDSSPFIYFSDGRNLGNIYTLDARNMKFLPFMKTSVNNFRVDYVIGVRNGVITLKGHMSDGHKCLMSARLPDKYYHRAPPVSREAATILKAKEKLEAAEKRWANEKASLIERYTQEAEELIESNTTYKHNIEYMNEEAFNLRGQFKKMATTINDQSQHILRLQAEIAKLNNAVNMHVEQNSSLVNDELPLPPPQIRGGPSGMSTPAGTTTPHSYSPGTFPPTPVAHIPSHSPSPTPLSQNLMPPVVPPSDLPPPPPPPPPHPTMQPPPANAFGSGSFASPQPIDTRASLLADIEARPPLRPVATRALRDGITEILRTEMNRRDTFINGDDASEADDTRSETWNE